MERAPSVRGRLPGLLGALAALSASSAGELTPAQAYFKDGSVLLIQSAHSDIFWLGAQNDIVIDAKAIVSALDMMKEDPHFTWQHECILFLRAFVELYPDRVEELAGRMREGRFDIGATFTEPYESTLYNELLLRQMYEGRKWFLEHFPGVDSAVVAFHQDGPLRALQMPQVYAKAGVKYLKASRLNNTLFRWRSPDGSSLLTFEQHQYCDLVVTGPPLDAKRNVTQSVLANMEIWGPQFRAGGLPAVLPMAYGCDYMPPALLPDFFANWTSESQRLFGAGAGPPLRHATFRQFFDALAGSGGLPEKQGERPNLWWAETSPTHHRLYSDLRRAARTLPAVEAFATFEALMAGSWANYPAEVLAEAWLNVTLADHGLAPEATPFSMPCVEGKTPLLCNLVRPNSPKTADRIYALKYRSAAAAGDALLAASQQGLADALSTPGLAVFNALSWPVVGPAFAAEPAGLGQRTFDGRAVLMAQAPAFGFATYGAAGVADGAVQDMVGATWVEPYTNKFFKITPAVGGLQSMIDLRTGTELFDTSKLLAGEWISLAYSANGASETHTYRHPGTQQGGADSGVPTFNASMAFQRLADLAPRWSCVEQGPVRAVFQTSPAKAAHATVVLELAVYSALPRVDLTVRLLGWDSAFGVANRVVFPLRTKLRDVQYSVPFGTVRVGRDENIADDAWTVDPPPESAFERGWAERPREVADWIHGQVTADVGLTLASADIGMFDWVDASGRYPSTQTVLAPEMLIHTNSNQGPFLDEAGDHVFELSLFAEPRPAWRRAVEATTPLQVRKTRGVQGGVQSHGFLEIGGEGLWATALKKEQSGDGVVLRVVEMQGEAAAASVRWYEGAPLGPALRTDIIERGGEPAGNFSTTGFGIETYRFPVVRPQPIVI